MLSNNFGGGVKVASERSDSDTLIKFGSFFLAINNNKKIDNLLLAIFILLLFTNALLLALGVSSLIGAIVVSVAPVLILVIGIVAGCLRRNVLAGVVTEALDENDTDKKKYYVEQINLAISYSAQWLVYLISATQISIYFLNKSGFTIFVDIFSGASETVTSSLMFAAFAFLTCLKFCEWKCCSGNKQFLKGVEAFVSLFATIFIGFAFMPQFLVAIGVIAAVPAFMTTFFIPIMFGLAALCNVGVYIFNRVFEPKVVRSAGGFIPDIVNFNDGDEQRNSANSLVGLGGNPRVSPIKVDGAPTETTPVVNVQIAVDTTPTTPTRTSASTVNTSTPLYGGRGAFDGSPIPTFGAISSNTSRISPFNLDKV